MVCAGFGSWSEVQAIAEMDRRAIAYSLHMRGGGTVNWDTGAFVAPRR